MFWALAMQPRKKYTQTLNKNLHVSMASMDLASSGNEPVRILLVHDNKQFLICTLVKDKLWQVPLDLNLKKNSSISFICDGQGYVHLTGYLLPNKGVDYSSTDFEEDKANEKKNEMALMCMKRKAESQDRDCKRAKLTREESFDESSEDDDTDYSDSDSDTSSSSIGDYLDDEDMENGEKEENNDDDDDDDDEEEEEQEHEQQKLATSQKHEEKKIENQQQKKNKHNKQNEINKEEIKQEQQSKKQKKKVEQAQQTDNKKNTSNINKVKKRIVEGGVKVQDLKVGNGQLAISGCLVTVYYVGRTKIGKEEQIIDEVTPEKSKGFKIRLGRGRSIKGFEMGVIGMKVGGKRRITIPPNMGYGAEGLPPLIPANSTLVYDVELTKVIY